MASKGVGNTAIGAQFFDPSKPAVFIWEAVTQYISADAVSRALTFVGSCAAGSVLVFTYILKSVIERRSEIPAADNMLDTVGKNGAPWVFGLEPDDLVSYLKPFRLKLTADVGNSDFQEKYLKPLNRSLLVSQVERVSQAMVTLR